MSMVRQAHHDTAFQYYFSMLCLYVVFGQTDTLYPNDFIDPIRHTV